jgi:spore maturation protein CgeB
VKFLVFNNDYRAFLDWLYQTNEGLETRPYEEQLRVRIESSFGLADFYSHNLMKNGHEAYDLFVNNEHAQKAWAREHDLRVPKSKTAHLVNTLQEKRHRAANTRLRLLKPLVNPFLRVLDQKGTTSRESWFYEILSAQVRRNKPDVLINLTMETVTGSFLKEVKPFVKWVVGQHAAPLPPENDFGVYDLILSSLPNQVAFFRSGGVKTEPFRLGFEPRILNRLTRTGTEYPVSFVGTISGDHETRMDLLEAICRHSIDLSLWGNMVKRMPDNSPLRKCFIGMAWGMAMYQILHDSRITLNHHIGVSNAFMRRPGWEPCSSLTGSRTSRNCLNRERRWWSIETKRNVWRLFDITWSTSRRGKASHHQGRNEPCVITLMTRE